MPEVELPNPEELREQAQDRKTKRIALSVAVYAVVLAISSLGGQNAMKEAMLAQMQASNKWAHYQAKSTREYVAKMTLLRLGGSDATTKQLDDDVGKYSHEKDEIKVEAEKLEEERNVAMKRDPYFDYAEVLLQIAIVLASVAILSKSKPPYLVSLVLAIVGAFFCFNGWTLWFNLPGIGH
jgi:Domain of unknown function (DUF4337)